MARVFENTGSPDNKACLSFSKQTATSWNIPLEAGGSVIDSHIYTFDTIAKYISDFAPCFLLLPRDFAGGARCNRASSCSVIYGRKFCYCK